MSVISQPRLRLRAGRVARGISNLVFPPVCSVCGILCERHDSVCADCWSRLRFIERPFCDVMGTPFAYDMGDAILSPEAIADPPPFSKARSAVLYDDMARRIVHRLKYKDRTELATLMGGWMVRAGADLFGSSDAVIAVPLHWRRLLGRRYNQSAELARSVAGMTGLAYLPGILVRKKSTRQQVGLSRQARLDNLRAAFSIAPAGRSRIVGRRLVLIDDVYTTGATARTAVTALLRAGASDVSVLTFARVAAD